MENLADLVEKAKKESNFMESLLRQFTPLIRHFAHKLPYEYSDAEQDITFAFLQLMRGFSLENMRSQDNKYLLKYIKRLIENRFIDLLYKRHQIQNSEELLEDIKMDIPCDPIFETKIQLIQLIKPLTTIQKEVLYLKYFYGYSDSEIFHKLHITRQAVNRTKNRALEELRKLYGIGDE